MLSGQIGKHLRGIGCQIDAQSVRKTVVEMNAVTETLNPVEENGVNCLVVGRQCRLGLEEETDETVTNRMKFLFRYKLDITRTSSSPRCINVSCLVNGMLMRFKCAAIA